MEGAMSSRSQNKSSALLASTQSQAKCCQAVHHGGLGRERAAKAAASTARLPSTAQLDDKCMLEALVQARSMARAVGQFSEMSCWVEQDMWRQRVQLLSHTHWTFLLPMRKRLKQCIGIRKQQGEREGMTH